MGKAKLMRWEVGRGISKLGLETGGQLGRHHDSPGMWSWVLDFG